MVDANENLMFMCRGSKRWTLFPPEQSELLYEGFCKVVGGIESDV